MAVIEYVQHTSKNVAGVNNTTLAYTSNVTAGNRLVVTLSFWSSTAGLSITTPTDTLGNTYLPAIAEHSNSNNRSRTFYADSPSGGANTVTFDISGTGTSNELLCFVSEWSGLGDPVTTNQATGTSTTPASGDVTPPEDNCLLYGTVEHNENGGTLTNEVGWTSLGIEIPAAAVKGATQYKIQTTATTEDADWTSGGSSAWMAHIVVFAPAIGQALIPSGTVSTGSWASTGASLWGVIDEDSVDDADYISTLTASADCEVSLSSGTDPAASTGHVVRYRLKGDGVSGITVALRQGTTTIASWTHDPAPTSWTTYAQTLTGGQADSITDYTALRLRFTEV